MNDAPRRQAITLTLALLLFAYREGQRLSVAAADRDPLAHSVGAVVEDELRRDAERVVR